MSNTAALKKIDYPVSPADENSQRAPMADNPQAIIDATIAGNLDLVETYLEQGGSTDSRDSNGITLLMWAARKGHADLVQSLLAAGADPNLSDPYGSTALFLATFFDAKLDVVRALIDAGADINSATTAGHTPLMAAASGGYTYCLNQLLKAGAQVNAQKGRLDGRTALMLAAENGFVDEVKALLAAGADPSITDSKGHTAALIALTCNFDEVVALLPASEADLVALEQDTVSEEDLADRTRVFTQANPDLTPILQILKTDDPAAEAQADPSDAPIETVEDPSVPKPEEEPALAAQPEPPVVETEEPAEAPALEAEKPAEIPALETEEPAEAPTAKSLPLVEIAKPAERKPITPPVPRPATVFNEVQVHGGKKGRSLTKWISLAAMGAAVLLGGIWLNKDQGGWISETYLALTSDINHTELSAQAAQNPDILLAKDLQAQIKIATQKAEKSQAAIYANTYWITALEFKTLGNRAVVRGDFKEAARYFQLAKEQFQVAEEKAVIQAHKTGQTPSAAQQAEQNRQTALEQQSRQAELAQQAEQNRQAALNGEKTAAEDAVNRAAEAKAALDNSYQSLEEYQQAVRVENQALDYWDRQSYANATKAFDQAATLFRDAQTRRQRQIVQIKTLLEKYRQAYEGKSLERMRSLRTTIEYAEAEILTNFFSFVMDLQVTMNIKEDIIAFEAGKAVAIIDVNMNFAGGEGLDGYSWKMEFVEGDSKWLISTVETYP